MKESDELWRNIVEARGHAPRADIIEYVKAVIAEARTVSLEQLTKSNSASGMLEGEVVASKLITGLGQQEWLEEDDELSHILELAGDLDRQIDDRQNWIELFEAVDCL